MTITITDTEEPLDQEVYDVLLSLKPELQQCRIEMDIIANILQERVEADAILAKLRALNFAFASPSARIRDVAIAAMSMGEVLPLAELQTISQEFDVLIKTLPSRQSLPLLLSMFGESPSCAMAGVRGVPSLPFGINRPLADAKKWRVPGYAR